MELITKFLWIESITCLMLFLESLFLYPMNITLLLICTGITGIVWLIFVGLVDIKKEKEE